MIKLVQVAMIAALTVSGAALAQSAPDAGTPANPGSAAPEKKTSSRLLRGEVEAVDIEAKTLTVKAKKGGEVVDVVVETDAQTQFIVKGAKATLVDIRKGMSVTVMPDVGIATKVTATVPKAAPKRTRGSTTRPSNP